MTRRSRVFFFGALLALAAAAWWTAARTTFAGGPESTPAAVSGLVLAAAKPAAVEPTSEDLRTPASETEDPTEETPGTTATFGLVRLFGDVTDSDGRSFAWPETHVGLTRESGSRRTVEIVDSKYSFDDLEPGRYVLESRKPGLKNLTLEVTLIAEHPVHRLDLRIERAWTITVRVVTPDGEDLRNRLEEEAVGYFVKLSILTTVEPPGDHLPPSLLMNRTIEGVSLQAQNLVPGDPRDDRVFVQANPPVFVSVLLRDRVLATQEVRDFVDELSFVVSIDQVRALLAGLKVRVVNDDTGMPATEAWVSLQTRQSAESGVKPDEQGYVTFNDRVPGLYEVQAFLKGHAVERRAVELPPGKITDVGTITLRKGLRLRGRCVDEAGNPRQVPAYLTPIDGRSANNRFLLKIDGDGSFDVPSLPAGTFSVRVDLKASSLMGEGENGWAAVPMVVELREESVDGLVIVVKRAVKTTLRPVAAEVVGMRYEVISLDGLVCETGRFYSPAAIGLDLAPGNYSLRLTAKDSKVRELPLTVGTEPLAVEILP